jgi:carbon storage regulator
MERQEMLVISCLVGESIRIGEDIEIHILKRSGGSVPIGIAAPSDVPVHRQGLSERIRAEGPANPDAPRAAPEAKRPVRPLIRLSPANPSSGGAPQPPTSAAGPRVIYRRARRRLSAPRNQDDSRDR